MKRNCLCASPDLPPGVIVVGFSRPKVRINSICEGIVAVKYIRRVLLEKYGNVCIGKRGGVISIRPPEIRIVQRASLSFKCIHEYFVDNGVSTPPSRRVFLRNS